MKREESVFKRRDVLNGLAGVGAIGLAGVTTDMLLGYLTGVEVPEPESITVGGDALAVLKEQRFVLVPYGPRPVMIFQLPDGEVRALSAVCTHGQCNVRYRPEQNDIYCGCHHGRFTVDGRNVPGTPPPEPLRPFQVEAQSNGTLVVRATPTSASEGQSG